jgi:DNA polymerase-3 subunit gamma/tau
VQGVSAEVWSRKWRPRTFNEVVGQKHVTQTLARAVALDRVAHAYLFCGPRGTGKTSTARILAKAVNCEANRHESGGPQPGRSRGQPCDECDSCRSVTEGRALDLIEMDAASNRGIDEIRSLRDKVGYSPNSSRYKVYLIDEVHELTQFAFDALLKTLEEPPAHVLFVLATTEAHKVPETILSRCQRFDFTRIKLADIVARLRQIAEAEGIEITSGALELIARRATGSLRDAENLFEQTVAAHGNVLTEDNIRGGAAATGDQRATAVVKAALQRRLADALNLVAEVRDDGDDLRQFTAAVVQHLRSVLLVRAGAEGSLALSADAIEALRVVAAETPVIEVLRLAKSLSATDFRADPQSPLPLELALIEFVETPVLAPPAQKAGQPGNEEARPKPTGLQPSGAVDRIRSAITPRSGPPPLARATAVEVVPSARSNGTVGAVGTPASVSDSDSARLVARQSGAPAAVTLEDAQRRFRDIYERCSELDRSAARLLNSGGCDIVGIDAAVVTIGMRHPRMVTLAAAVESTIRRSVNEILDGEYRVTYTHVPDVPSRLQLSAAEQPSHLLDEALKLGAKPVGRA